MPELPRRLSEFDLGVLRDRGVSLDTARRNRLHTAAGSLVIPYANLTGAYNRYALRRPHTPPVYDGKPRKYIAPTGLPSRPYCPAECRTALLDADVPLFVTEGPLKALALAQLGYTVVALQGVWNWKVAGTDELLPELAAVPLAGRAVYVVFDFDVKPVTRRNVGEARRRLARAVLKAGASEVRNVELPPATDGGKQGVDDYLVANGSEAFDALITTAEPMTAASVMVVPLTRAEGRTDVANAARLVAKHGADLRWVGPWDKFILWDGRRWKLDQCLAVDLLAKDVATDLFAEIGAALKKEPRPDKDVVAMMAHAKYSNSKDGVRNLTTLAKSEVAVGPDVLDTDPWLLNCENGTLDLRSGELRDHDRDDFISKLAPVAFDPAVTCPVWESFLSVIFAGDAELIAYVRRLVGYCLTGDTSEHILPFLHGTGANGKSTLCETVLRLLGPDYAMKAAPDLLMAKRGESHPTDRADLFGKRFVACIETEEGRRMAEALMKELTGGDRVRARRMREDFWEFSPTHHVWLASNHKPKVTGTDNGIWRRIKLIPFDVTIPDAEQDKGLKGKLAAELPGILNWALAGCLDWQRGGMNEPAVVRAKTGEYSAEMDEVGQFVDELCETGPEYIAAASDLFRAFQESTDTRINQHSFGARLRQRCFEKCRTTRGKHGWKGLRLKSDAEREQLAEIARQFTANVRAKRVGGTK